ncbi:MAG: hypothetical protein INR69_09750 [Mucilaginibacter polytrichastri]|nr:hypothetical protein [Mucilaginibacter polytrichastri]
MSVVIQNRADLKAEIARLEGRKTDLELKLKKQLNSPANIFAAAVQLFKGSNTDSSKFSELFKAQDLYGVIARFAMPLLLNKTLFRRSNFIVKAIVTMVSQKASGAISKNKIQHFADKITGIFKKKAKKPKPVTAIAVKSPADIVPPPLTY